MEIEQKIELLNELKTDKLIADIQEQENKLEILLQDDAKFRSENVPFLAAYGDDCRFVKNLIAELSMEPPVNSEGKKLTVVQTEAWLRQRRKDDPALAAAIKQQDQTTFTCETNRINIDMAKKRLESLRGVLGLRTAQVEFLR